MLPSDTDRVVNWLRALFGVLLVSVLLLINASERLSITPERTSPPPETFAVVVYFVCMLLILLTLYMRFRRLRRLLRPEARSAATEWLVRFRSTYVFALIFATFIACAAYLLRALGEGSNASWPLYLASLALLMLSFPRRPT